MMTVPAGLRPPSFPTGSVGEQRAVDELHVAHNQVVALKAPPFSALLFRTGSSGRSPSPRTACLEMPWMIIALPSACHRDHEGR